jgi:hypothetical protein
MAEESFEFSNPRVERIGFGHGKVTTLGDEVARLGAIEEKRSGVLYSSNIELSSSRAPWMTRRT